MITKAQVKDIRSLALQKYRQERNAFLVEGDKVAREWLQEGSNIEMIVALPAWLQENEALLKRHAAAQIIEINEQDLERISSLKTPHKVALVATMPAAPDEWPVSEWCIVLDHLQDPGNLGSIIRIADWFGIRHIVCSPGCADYYNPKVLQAAMGGHLRVQLHTAELPTFLKQVTIPILAALLDGHSVYETPRQDAAVLLIGNESKGISGEVATLATHRITIPRIGGAESLNAAVSAGILCALLAPR